MTQLSLSSVSSSTVMVDRSFVSRMGLQLRGYHLRSAMAIFLLDSRKLFLLSKIYQYYNLMHLDGKYGHHAPLFQ